MALYQYCIGGHVQPNTQNWHFHHVRPLFLFGRRRIQCQRETLVTGQRKAELEIEDIEHAAEFYNLDASHGYQLYKLLHDARVRRRKCKNAIAWIDYILEQALDRFIENDPSPRIAGTRSRDYAPRALPALFEWENEGQTPTANLCP